MRKWSLNVEIAGEAGVLLNVIEVWRRQVALWTLAEEEVLTRAAAASSRTMMTSSHSRLIPHIIAPPIM